MNIGGTNMLGINGALTNAGVINWGGTGSLNVTVDGFASFDGTIVNAAHGMFVVSNDQALTFTNGYPNSATFNNYGTFVKQSGTNTPINIAFNNFGLVSVQSGTINLSASHSLTGGTLEFGLNSLTNFGRMTLSGASALAGGLEINLNGGYVPAINNSFQVLSYSSSSGVFGNSSGTTVPPVADWQSTQGATALTITFRQLVPQITWPTPAAIVYGTPLSGTQLDATASSPGGGSSLTGPGTFSYKLLPAGTSLSAGNILYSGSNQTLSVAFTPSVADQANFTTATATVNQVVLPAPLTVTTANATRVFGQANPVFQGTIVGLENGDNITANYSCAATNASPVGAYPIMPSLNDPADLRTNYAVNLVNGTLSVSQASVTITWASPAPIVYGTALGAAQLDATANVPGTFAYNPAAGSMLNVGTDTLSVTFTPSDATDYSVATASVSLVVSASPAPEITSEPLFPLWAAAGLSAGVAAVGVGFLARRRNPTS
jgi:hypothetical protein